MKTHPFAVEAFFDSSIVLTFAVPKAQLQPMLPPCLTVDTLNEKWGFLAVALVQTKNLRPKGFPAFLGKDFFLIGYRIFVRYTDNSGKRLRGLYILKSQTDKKQMEIFGNLFTNYRYTTIDIDYNRTPDGACYVRSTGGDFDIEMDTNNQITDLPESSPFTDWKEARKFAGPLPFTFSYDSSKKTVLIVEGVRQNWRPRPVKVISQHIGYVKSLGGDKLKLANAFVIENIPYYWKKGRTEKWAG